VRDPFRLPIGGPGRLGLLLAHLDEGRARTLRVLRSAPHDRLHWSSTAFPNSLAGHLAHLGAIELDWLYCDLLGREIPAEALTGCPITDVRGPDGRLDPAADSTLEDLLAWLESCRARLRLECRRLDEDALDQLVEGLEGAATPEWILTHLAQHEAEHRGVMRRMIASWEAGG
jgi:uncharacterized damage-inducible protein DinB